MTKAALPSPALRGCSRARLARLFFICATAAAPAAGCSPAPKTASPATQTSTPADGTPSDAAGGVGTAEPSNDAPQASCHPKCAQWLAEGRSLLGKAKALGDAPNVAVVYGQAGDAMARAWRGCDLREPTAEDLACEGAATAVADMTQAYGAAERPDGSVLAALVASDERWKRATAGASASASRLAELGAVAEKAATADPKAAQAPKSLAAAVYAYLGGGDLAGAERAASLYRRNYGTKEPDDVALQATAIALVAGEAGDWRKALAVLTAAGQPARAAAPRTRLLWHAAHGRALEATGKAAQGGADYDRVLALWGDSGPANVAAFVGHADPRPMLDRESVVDAVGDAHLHRGRRAAARAAEAAMPSYRGPATVAGVNEFVKGPLAEWITKRQQALTEVQRDFARIAAIRPVPPALAMVQARAAMARAWSDFAKAFDAAPPPKHVADDAELASAWSQSMTAASRQLREKAQTELDACAKLAERLPPDEQGKACEPATP